MNPSEVSTYNTIALGPNASIYAYYAKRIVATTATLTGNCLDVGCGGGYLGLALARITPLDFIFFDQSPAMLQCAEDNITNFDCRSRARTLHGRVQAIPLTDDSIDLVVSRGSVPFWDDLATAFSEIYRVLRPGGHAYVGGGLGDPKTRAETEERMRRHHPEWQNKDRRPPHHDNEHYQRALTAAAIDPFAVNRSDEGLWITFRKGQS
ncbi:MAG: class I SAM-dependent methyltransferase [Pseudomonadota bacterium]